jgi:hypothetical protein
MARVILAGAGLLGLFLALDAVFLSVLLIVNTLIGGDLNPYAGLFLFVVVPVVVAAGGVGAWGAYRLWLIVPRQSPEDVSRNVVMRT